MRIDRDTLLQRLDRIGTGYEIVPLSPDWDLVVSAFGGRIHGPFFQGEDPTGWVAPQFETDDMARDLARTRNWNIGAQRLWLSPELRIFVGDRTRFWDTFVVPDALDPGTHELTRDGADVVLAQSGELADSGRFEVTRRISPRPGATLPGDLPQVACAGFRHTIDLRSESAALPVLPWIVAQVEPGGEAVIPADADTDAMVMLGAPPEPVLKERAGAIRMPVECTALYKIGVPAAQSDGQLGYRLPLGDSSTFTLYRCSHDRAGRYPDEPAATPGIDGCATFVFQDDGSLGRYGELEFVGQDTSRDFDGWRTSKLEIDVLSCVGPDAAIRAVEAAWLAGTFPDPA